MNEKPAIYIAIGGTGKLVLTHLRKRGILSQLLPEIEEKEEEKTAQSSEANQEQTVDIQVQRGGK